jgi:hypothetical protein
MKLFGTILAGLLVAAGAFGVIFLLALLMGWVTMVCWNETMPYLFGLKTISYWQGVFLNILTSTFFKSTVTNNSKSE